MGSRRGLGQPTDLRTLVRQVFRAQGKEPYLLVSLLREHWPDIVGEQMARNAWPQRLERGTLWLSTPDACWAYELQFFKQELMASLQAFLESETIRDLRFTVGEGPAEGPAGDSAAVQGTAPAAVAGVPPTAGAPSEKPHSPVGVAAAGPAAQPAARVGSGRSEHGGVAVRASATPPVTGREAIRRNLRRLRNLSASHTNS